MHTARLPTVSALVTTRCQYRWGCPQVNKFEQVSSNGHQMSPSIGVLGPGMGGVPCLILGALYSEVQYIIGRTPSAPEQKERQTHVKTLLSHNLVGGR